MRKILTAFALSSFVASSAFAAAGGSTVVKHRTTKIAAHKSVSEGKTEAKPVEEAPKAEPTKTEAKPVKKPTKKHPAKPAPAPAATEAPATK